MVITVGLNRLVFANTTYHVPAGRLTENNPDDISPVAYA